MIVWALFDSGNGCYSQAAKNFPEIELYSIGLDKEHKNNHFINLNLATYSIDGKANPLFKSLDELPRPDVILASPPCESWSVASAMKGGNASWKQETGDALFQPQTPLSRFTIRDFIDYREVQFKPEKSLINRINGELCIFNTIQIILHYDPKYYVIENPAASRIWEYVDRVLGFEIQHDNLTYYNNYGYPIKKPTRFKSNIELKLKKEKIPNEVDWGKFDRKGGAYNSRSNIPLKLVNQIFSRILEASNETNTELSRQ